jgi:hypothetical protein
MREIVKNALTTKTTPVASTPSTTTTKKPGTGKTTTVKPPAGGTEDLNDACAYHPAKG